MVLFGEARYGMKRFFLGLWKYSMWKVFKENFSLKQSIKSLGYQWGCHNGANNLGVCMGAEWWGDNYSYLRICKNSGGL